jgi:hypothetical protein
MKCSSCGYENIEEANYCSNCKQPLDSSSADSEKVSQSFSSSATEPTASTASPVAAPAPAPSAAPAPNTAPVPSALPTQGTTPTPNISSTQYASAPYSQAPSYNTAPVRPAPYAYQQPYYYPSAAQRSKRPFTITDAYIIIGFVLAVVGIFAYAFILLPASIGFSVVGFVKRTNARTLGLSIAGIVVGVVACLIKIGMVLNELGVIPDWLSAGIF